MSIATLPHAFESARGWLASDQAERVGRALPRRIVRFVSSDNRRRLAVAGLTALIGLPPNMPWFCRERTKRSADNAERGSTESVDKPAGLRESEGQGVWFQVKLHGNTDDRFTGLFTGYDAMAVTAGPRGAMGFSSEYPDDTAPTCRPVEEAHALNVGVSRSRKTGVVLGVPCGFRCRPTDRSGSRERPGRGAQAPRRW